MSLAHYTVRIEGGSPEISAVASVVATSREEALALTKDYLQAHDNTVEYEENTGRSFEPEVRSLSVVFLSPEALTIDKVDRDGVYQ